MKSRWLVTASALSALVFGVVFTPAAHLYAWFGSPDPRLDVTGLSGTVAGGKADVVLWQGKPVAENVQWNWSPLALFLLRVGFDLRFGGPATGDGTAGLTATGQLLLSDTRVVAEASNLLQTAGYGSLPVRGRLVAQFDHLRLTRSGQPVAVQGGVKAVGLAWAIGQSALELGDFRADVRTGDEGELIADVASSEDNPIEAKGEATLRPDRVYETHIRVKARDNAPEQTRNLLRLMGRPDNQGYYHLRQQGRL